MTTYTIAYTENMIVAIVDTGSDINAAVREEGENAGVIFDNLRIAENVTLTDDTEEGDEVLFVAGHHTGNLSTSSGKNYRYAVKRN